MAILVPNPTRVLFFTGKGGAGIRPFAWVVNQTCPPATPRAGAPCRSGI